MQVLTRLAPAKLNLTLRVAGRRADGFHELESLVTRLAFGDELAVARHEDGCYALTCDDPTLPADGSNLVLRAARALARAAGVNHGAAFTLRKRIPAGAGLGGGSSDAATALMALNELWDLGLSCVRLAELAALLGSDVPLFLHAPLCVLRGRGERIEDRPERCRAWAVLLLPPVHCSTPAVYAAWDRRPPLPERPPLESILAVLHDPAVLMERLFNDLEPAAFDIAPELARLAGRATALAGGPVRMTGSGAALFRLFADPAEAEAFAAQARAELGVRAEVARTATAE